MLKVMKKMMKMLLILKQNELIERKTTTTDIFSLCLCLSPDSLFIHCLRCSLMSFLCVFLSVFLRREEKFEKKICFTLSPSRIFHGGVKNKSIQSTCYSLNRKILVGHWTPRVSLSS